MLFSENGQLLCSNSSHLVSLQLQNLLEIELLPRSLLDQLIVTRASRAYGMAKLGFHRFMMIQSDKMKHTLTE